MERAVKFVDWGVGDGFDETVGNEDAQNFLNALCIMGAGVVEKSVAVALGIRAEVVGVFLFLSVHDRPRTGRYSTCAMVRACCSRPML